MFMSCTAVASKPADICAAAHGGAGAAASAAGAALPVPPRPLPLQPAGPLHQLLKTLNTQGQGVTMPQLTSSKTTAQKILLNIHQIFW